MQRVFRNHCKRIVPFLFALALPAAAAAETWVKLASMPTARSEMSAAALDGKIYVPGGLGGTRKLEVFDPATNTWRALANTPAGRHHHATVAHDGNIYVFGGADESWRASATAWRYDPRGNKWQALAEMPEVRYAGAALSLGRYLYVVGGDGPSGKLLRYDPAQNSWSMLAATAERREHTAAAALDGKIYVLGGRWQSVGAMTSVEEYDPGSDQWRAAAPMRVAHSGHAAVAFDGEIVVLGGEVLGAERATLDDVEVYNPATRVWEKSTPLPLALHGAPAAAVNGALYILGGSERAGAIVNRGLVYKRTFKKEPALRAYQQARQFAQGSNFRIRRRRNTFALLAKAIAPRDIETERLSRVRVPGVRRDKAHACRRKIKSLDNHAVDRGMRLINADLLHRQHRIEQAIDIGVFCGSH